jgi:hypothetical protein
MVTAEPTPEETTPPPNESVPPRSRRGGCLAGCLITLPILYALSWPVHSVLCTAVFDAGLFGLWDALEQIGNVAYQPLQYLYDRFDWVREFYDWYFSLFWRWMPQP